MRARIHFNREIELLKKELYRLCGLVEERLRLAVQAVKQRDEAQARAIIEGDAEIDQLEVKLEEDCLKIMALYQPVAVDLRFLVAALKVNNDLERVGDLAVNIAERAVELAKEPPGEVPLDFAEMAGIVQSMVKRSIDALIAGDPELAREVCCADDRVDLLNRQAFEQVRAGLAEHPGRVSTLLSLLSVSRHLERIADHATNIAEDVIYMVEGEIARHGSACWPNDHQPEKVP